MFCVCYGECGLCVLLVVFVVVVMVVIVVSSYSVLLLLFIWFNVVCLCLISVVFSLVWVNELVFIRWCRKLVLVVMFIIW